MSTIRQDAWTEDEDLLLAETVLRHIREGSTQLSAFEEVGKGLSRTSAACGFRWNSLVRKQYGSAIALAKKQRKELNSKKKVENKTRSGSGRVKKQTPQKPSDPQVDISMVITYLEGLRDIEASMINSNNEKERLKEELKTANEKTRVLEEDAAQIKEHYGMMEKDYQALLTIMDRARKMAGDRDTERETTRNKRYTIDKDLEKVNK